MDLGIDGVHDPTWIGSGGHATVYSVLRPDGARVAVKVLAGRAGSEKERRSFEREQEHLRRLSGVPNVVPILSSGLTRHGEPYFVMPLYPTTLQEKIDRSGGLDWREACSALIPVCHAVAAAHEHPERLLHRDLKPSNILLDQAGAPYVGDFGIATRNNQTTTTGAARGTLGFIPVEIFEGEQASERSDIYALGATLLASITGHAPFVTGPDDSDAAILMRVLNDDPPDLGDRGVPPRLDALVRSTMHKQPDERPASARALAAELAACVGADPTATSTDHDQTRSVQHLVVGALSPEQQPPQRRRRPWMYVAAALLIVGAITAGALVRRDAEQTSVRSDEPAANDATAQLTLDTASADAPSTTEPTPPSTGSATTTMAPTTTSAAERPLSGPGRVLLSRRVDIERDTTSAWDSNQQVELLDPATGRVEVVATETWGAWPSPAGTSVLYSSNAEVFNELYISNDDGSTDQITDFNAERFSTFSADWSPDGTRIVFANDVDGDGDALDDELWLLDLASSELTQLTNDDDYDFGPAWSPDGTMLAFVSGRAGGAHELHTLDLSTGAIVQRTFLGRNMHSASWSADGRFIATIARDPSDPNILDLISVELSTGTVDEHGPATHHHWHPESNTLLAVTGAGGLQVVGPSELPATMLEPENIQTAFWSLDGSQVAYMSSTLGGPVLLDIETGQQVVLGGATRIHGWSH